MTFTEAAVEILRRSGKPLHFKEIATEAVNAGLLSHVGQTPEVTMGARLVSMAKREHERKVVALDGGNFALVEWGLPLPTTPAESVVIEPPVDESAPQYRPKERHPPLQPEILVGGRRDDRRRSRGDDEGHRKKRYAPPADVAWQWLKERGEPATLAELAAGLRENDRIAEALERDLGSLERALKEENRRRRDGRRSPLFEIEDGKVKALEQQKEQPRERRPDQQQRQQKEKERDVRPAGADEQRRNVARTVRRRLSSLDGAALERIAVALLEAQGYRDLHMARRSGKEGALYLARHKWGASELRYAIRILKPGRDLGRNDVQDIRRDVQHFSSQIGVVIGTAECMREAKSEANITNQAPAMLFGGEALADALVEAGLGATRRLIEWFEYDDEFFTNAGAGEPLPDEENAPPPVSAEEAGTESPESSNGRNDRDRNRRPRDRRRGQRPREEGSDEPTVDAAPVAESTEAPSEQPAPTGEIVAAPPPEPPAPAETPAEAPAPDQTPTPAD